MDSGARGEAVLADLLAVSTGLDPEGLGRALTDAGRRLGGTDVMLMVADLHQHHLRAFPGFELEPQEVETTLPGRAYMAQAPVWEPEGGGQRLWLPIVDSGVRLGVLGALVERVDQATLRTWATLASMAGELIVAKNAYGDAIVRARRARPVTLAAELRWALLPPLTFSSPRVVVSGIFEPAYDIAGDAFDYAVDRDVVHLTVLDAMGHGLEASRMADLAVVAYRHSRRLGQGLVASALAMDQVVAETFGDSRFVTAQLAELDLASGVLSVVNAGHPNAVLLRDGRDVGDVTVPPARPLGLGLHPVVTRTQLEPGDAVVFYSDGVTEARDPGGGFFGRERLGRLLGELLGAGVPHAEALRRVVGLLHDHEQAPSRDDATLVLLSWLPRATPVGD